MNDKPVAPTPKVRARERAQRVKWLAAKRDN